MDGSAALGRILAFKRLIYFTKSSKNTNGGQNAPGRPWWTSPCKGTWALWGFLAETQARCSNGWHILAAFPLLLFLQLWLLVVPEVTLNAAIVPWKHGTPETSCALALSAEVKAWSPAAPHSLCCRRKTVRAEGRLESVGDSEIPRPGVRAPAFPLGWAGRKGALKPLHPHMDGGGRWKLTHSLTGLQDQRVRHVNITWPCAFFKKN